LNDGCAIRLQRVLSVLGDPLMSALPPERALIGATDERRGGDLHRFRLDLIVRGAAGDEQARDDRSQRFHANALRRLIVGLSLDDSTRYALRRSFDAFGLKR
jgi:hypothetical protein